MNDKLVNLIGLTQAYLGCLVFTHWMIWSYNTYGIFGTEIFTYLTTFGGIL